MPGKITIKNPLPALLAVVCAFAFVLSSAAFRDNGGGTNVGTGGDWRRIMIGQAQHEAANWTNAAALHRDLFDHDPALDHMSPTYKLVTLPDALETLGSDIIRSGHIYREDGGAPRNEYTTCAWPNDPATPQITDIVFSLTLCEGGLQTAGQTFANRLLIHESVHHLLLDQRIRDAVHANFSGNDEERYRKEDQLCDDVALAIHRLFEVIVQNGRPHWRAFESPYFPNPRHDAEAFDGRGYHVTAWTGVTGNPTTKNRMIIWGGCHEGEHNIYSCGDDRYLNDGAIYSPSDNTWQKMSTTGAPSGRADASFVWTGTESNDATKNKLIVFGGCAQGDGCDVKFNDGGIYDPTTNQWESITPQPLAPRFHHSMVWTGSEFIVWGGRPANDGTANEPAPLGDGGIYNPVTKEWRPINTNAPNGPTPRGYHTAIWTADTGTDQTSRKMLLWGGCAKENIDACAAPMSDGYLFDPQTSTWVNLETTGQAPKPRHNYSAVFVKDQARLYIFGGFDASKNVLSDGAVLDLKTLRWSPLAPMADGRFKHRAVWAGDKMMIFGGKTFNSSTHTFELASTVVAYVPAPDRSRSSGRWITYKTDEMVPLKAIEHSAVWTGSSMIVWGGQIFDRGFTNTGSQFFPGTSSP